MFTVLPVDCVSCRLIFVLIRFWPRGYASVSTIIPYRPIVYCYFDRTSSSCRLIFVLIRFWPHGYTSVSDCFHSHSIHTHILLLFKYVHCLARGAPCSFGSNHMVTRVALNAFSYISYIKSFVQETVDFHSCIVEFHWSDSLLNNR